MLRLLGHTIVNLSSIVHNFSRRACLISWAAPALAAAGAWVSLHPYFFWTTRALDLLLAAVAFAVAGVLALIMGLRPRSNGIEPWGAALLSLFLILISVMPRMDGGHAKWFALLPVIWAFAIFSDELRVRCYLIFVSLFALSVLPGIGVWIWTAVGFPVTFTAMIPANPAMSAAGGGGALNLPGVIFNQENAIVLPTGGVMFRLCGMFDEPGTVGTIAALSLAGCRYRIGSWRNAILYTAGVMSFSLAFIALAAVGLIGRAILTKKFSPLLALIPIALGLSLSLGWIPLGHVTGTVSRVSVDQRGAIATNEQPKAIVASGQELRKLGIINDRALPPMQELVKEYVHGDIKTLLFGLASDASVVRGGVSQVWSRILTDSGAIGFALLFAGTLCIFGSAWSRSAYSVWGILFAALYLASVYQRPVIWLPYTLTLLFCGVIMAGKDGESGVRQHRHLPKG